MDSAKTIIFGHKGFIGSHLLASLENSSGERIEEPKKYSAENFIFCAAANPNKLPNTQAFRTDPSGMVELNIKLTLNFLESCRLSEPERIIFFSNDKVYGNQSGLHTEETPLKVDFPYETSKIIQDVLAQTYLKTYGLNMLILRPQNFYSFEKEAPYHIIPMLCKEAAENKTTTLIGNPSAVRGYVYMGDLAGAMKLATSEKNIAGVYNFSSDDFWSNMQIAEAVSKISGAKIILRPSERKNEILSLKLGSEKFRKKFGWSPKIKLAEVLPRIYESYKRFS